MSSMVITLTVDRPNSIFISLRHGGPVILTEIQLPTIRTKQYEPDTNNVAIEADFDLAKEKKDSAR